MKTFEERLTEIDRLHEESLRALAQLAETAAVAGTLTVEDAKRVAEVLAEPPLEAK